MSSLLDQHRLVFCPIHGAAPASCICCHLLTSGGSYASCHNPDSEGYPHLVCAACYEADDPSAMGVACMFCVREIVPWLENCIHGESVGIETKESYERERN